jgi:RNA polymerase sigma-70 factor, ECF subfamily
VATLIRFTGDFDQAEDAVQEATLSALEHWTRDGIPNNPGAWLTTVAKRKALDRVRRESIRRGRETASSRLLDGPLDPESLALDDQPDELRLLFTCCHPALSKDAQIALALRTLCRLTTSEIARVFLVPDATIGQRISRAKKKISVAHIAYRIPEDHELPERLPAVLATIYLVFTTSHHATEGRLNSRIDLASDALRLAQLAAARFPDEPEVLGLLALILATHARRATRLDDRGAVVLLADQDRSQWDRNAIAKAASIVESILRRRRIGPFQLQAAIAVVHGSAATFAETDWHQIAELYRFLEHVQPTPVVRVNRAAAVSFASGPRAALALLDGLSQHARADVENWHLYWSARADLFRQLNDHEQAASNYRRALACHVNDSDREFLEMRLREVTQGP